MVDVVDARSRPKGSAGDNVRRFKKRMKPEIDKAIKRAIGDTPIGDIFNKDGIDVRGRPPKGVGEPSFRHGKGGVVDHVSPGNKKDGFVTGDRLPKPPGGGGGGSGSGANDSGEGEDEYLFHMDRDELLEYLFEELALPNMLRKGVIDANKTKPKRQGYSSAGPDDRRNLRQSMRNRMRRVVPLRGPIWEEIVSLLDEKKALLVAIDPDATRVDAGPPMIPPGQNLHIVRAHAIMAQIARILPVVRDRIDPATQSRLDEIDQHIQGLERQKSGIRFLDPIDLKFNHVARVPVTTTRAAMFCLMDVSGSMDEETKYRAKMFFALLKLFLDRHYEHVEVVFVRHHTVAEEVDEDRFFNDRTTGGTIVSTALEKMQEIMAARFPTDTWNIYGAQASDGDNWGGDDPKCVALLDKILPDVQGYFYTEITEGPPQSLWKAYQDVQRKHSDRFWQQRIESRQDIFKVFREFFKKRENINEAAAFRPSSLSI